MSTKYKILICSGILAIFLGVYGFTGGDSLPIPKSKFSKVKKQPQTVTLETRANDEGMVAAILIMPKSYLPTLKRFSQSALARDIKILRAELEVKDGQMMAVRQLNRQKRSEQENDRGNNSANNLPEVTSKRTSNREMKVVSSGFLYLMAGLQKQPFIH